MRAALAGTGRSISCAIANRLDDPRVRGLVLTARDLGPAERAQARRLRFRERLLELAIQPKLTSRMHCRPSCARQPKCSTWVRSVFGDCRPTANRCAANPVRPRQRSLPARFGGRELTATRFPAYFAQLINRQPIVVNDTHTSRLTTSFAGDRNWARVRAMLDVPVLVEGAISGVLSLQHNESRAWDDDDVSFANTTSLMLALALEAAQRQEAETRIEHLAWYDGLTGLPNRNLLRETMRDLIMTAANRKRRMAVMLIDLDRFKDVNDTLGHLVGDALIKSAADVLGQTVGDAGTVARLGAVMSSLC